MAYRMQLSVYEPPHACFFAFFCQVLSALKAGRSTELQKQQAEQMLINTDLMYQTRFFDPDLSTGKGRLEARHKALLEKGIISLKQAGRASADVARALSSALQCATGYGLDIFLPGKRMVPGGPLADLAMSPLSDRPGVKLLSDEASTNVKAANFLLSYAGVRGLHDLDKCHKKDNNVITAVKRCGLYPSMLKAAMLANVNRGPWLGGAFLEQKQESLDLYIQNMVKTPAMLAQHLEALASDLDVTLPSQATVEDCHWAVTALMAMRSFNRKSTSIELKRWHASSYVWPSLDSEWTGTLIVLEWLFKQLKEWSGDQAVTKELRRLLKLAGQMDSTAELAPEAAAVVNANDGAADHPLAPPIPDAPEPASLSVIPDAPAPGAMPEAAASAAVAVAEPHAAVIAAGGEQKPKRQPKPKAKAKPRTKEELERENLQQTLAAMRQKSHNTLELACMVLHQREVQIENRIIHEFQMCGRESSAWDMERQSTPVDSAHWYAHRALDGGYRLCANIASVLDRDRFLRRAHAHGGQAIPECAIRELYTEELDHAALIFNMAHEYMSLTAWSDMVHAETMPFTFAAILAPVHADSGLSVHEDALLACMEDWIAILEAEHIVFHTELKDTGRVQGYWEYDRDQPGAYNPDAPDVPEQLSEELPEIPAPSDPHASPKFPCLARLLNHLDFNKHQLVRELGCIASSPNGTDEPEWDPCHTPLNETLWQYFAAPANTKFWLEDVFRDAKQLLGKSSFNAERFARMDAFLQAAQKKALKGMPQVTLKPHEYLANVPCRRFVTSGCFAVPTDSQKVRRAEDYGTPFDIGEPTRDSKPLIDVSPLVDPEKQKRMEAGPGGEERSLFRPAGQASSDRSVSAMALLRAMVSKDSRTKELWSQSAVWGELLRQGHFFLWRRPDADPVAFLSLGSGGHATLAWAVKLLGGEGQAQFFSLSIHHAPIRRRTEDETTMNNLFWMFGHDVQTAQMGNVFGLRVQILIPALHPEAAHESINYRPGLLFEVLEELPLIAYCFKAHLPMKLSQLLDIARLLHATPAKRLTSKSSDFAKQAVIVATLIARKLFPDLEPDKLDEMVQAVCTTPVRDITKYDPLLAPVLKEMLDKGISGTKDAGRGQGQVKGDVGDADPERMNGLRDLLELELEMAEANAVLASVRGHRAGADQRAGRTVPFGEQTTPLDLIRRIPGKGQIPGCRIVENLEKQYVMGAYITPDNVKKTFWRQWKGKTPALGRQLSQQEAEDAVIMWLEVRHSHAVERGPVPLLPLPADCAAAPTSRLDQEGEDDVDGVGLEEPDAMGVTQPPVQGRGKNGSRPPSAARAPGGRGAARGRGKRQGAGAAGWGASGRGGRGRGAGPEKSVAEEAANPATPEAISSTEPALSDSATTSAAPSTASPATPTNSRKPAPKAASLPPSAPKRVRDPSASPAPPVAPSPRHAAHAAEPIVPRPVQKPRASLLSLLPPDLRLLLLDHQAHQSAPIALFHKVLQISLMELSRRGSWNRRPLQSSVSLSGRRPPRSRRAAAARLDSWYACHCSG